jgi:hypothetical protein
MIRFYSKKLSHFTGQTSDGSQVILAQFRIAKLTGNHSAIVRQQNTTLGTSLQDSPDDVTLWPQNFALQLD